MSDVNHLIRVKQALAEKYQRLATMTSSRPKKRQFTHRAVKYSRQVDQLRNSAD